MPGIGLITNPRSRLNRRDPSRIQRLGYLIGAHGQAEATRSLDDLHRACEDFHRERIDILGISGGDGTLHHTLTAMIRAYGTEPLPPIAILRGGTTRQWRWPTASVSVLPCRRRWQKKA